jgi:hypothetical protein
MNYEWAPSLVSALVTVIVTLAGVILYLRKNMPGNGNGCAKLDKEFHDQVATCTERFIQMAKDAGTVATSLENIDGRLENIETAVAMLPRKRR